MLNKTKAIVLHQVKYGDSSLVATLYTEKFGRISCMVSGVKSKKGKFPFTFFQPLTLLETDIYYRQKREIQRIKEASVLQPYQSIPFHISKNTVALFIAEVLYFSVREEESNPLLFTYILNALILLDSIESGLSVFHHWFLFHLSKYLGFVPPDHIFQNEENSGTEMEELGHLSIHAFRLLKMIAQSSSYPPDAKEVPSTYRNELLSELLRYYHQHIDGFRIKSHKILQEVFNN